MREIKFRAWAENAEAMVYQEDSFKWIGDGMMEFFVDDEGVKALYQIRENSDEEPTIDNPPIYSTDDMVKIMQYTGLKDKNGREIYEGDIVRVIEDNCMGGIYFGAIKHLSNWGIYGFNMLDAKVIKTRDFGQKSMGFLMKMFGNCFTLSEAFKHGSKSKFEVEVIGNIYENPELLEGDSN